MVFDNLAVNHKTFGKGTVVSSQGKYITVKFDKAQKIFVYPEAGFIAGSLDATASKVLVEVVPTDIIRLPSALAFFMIADASAGKSYHSECIS